jgi:glycosyltransferase involved in cell wall biosynthesis
MPQNIIVRNLLSTETTPMRLADQSWQPETIPLVSICCTTFNHGRYIQTALDSFLSQETSFPVEIVVHDDASTDNTAEIISSYVIRYPRIFRTILQHENQWKHKRRAMQIAMSSARGKFIALCEGDDYWTSPGKLELQIAMLLANPKSLLSFHGHIEIDKDGAQIPSRDYRTPSAGILPTGSYFRGMCESWQTASFVLRRELATSLPDWHTDLPFSDVTLISLASIRGPLCSLPGIHSCYRIHAGGMVGHNRLELDLDAQRRGSIAWLKSLSKLFENLVNETHDAVLAQLCRQYSINYLSDAVWKSRLIGDRAGMRNAIIKAFRISPSIAGRSVFLWKSLLIALMPFSYWKLPSHCKPNQNSAPLNR